MNTKTRKNCINIANDKTFIEHKRRTQNIWYKQNKNDKKVFKKDFCNLK